GVVAESLKVLAFDSGAAGANAVIAAGIAPDPVALAYQFGYLILPAITPIALWLGLNRDFIESLVHPAEEPEAVLPGQTQETEESCCRLFPKCPRSKVQHLCSAGRRWTSASASTWSPRAV